MWCIAESIRGLSEAARAFKIPVVSGNVSLYNETKGKSILPTPLLAVVGLMEDASKSVGTQFKSVGDRVFVLGITDDREMGGSEYMANYAGIEKGALPAVQYDLEVATGDLVRDLIQKGFLQSCHDLSSGGLAVALAESCFGINPIGATLSVEQPYTRADGLLFAETGARYLISCKPEFEEKVRQAAKRRKIPLSLEGTVGGEDISVEGVALIPLHEAKKQWKTGLWKLFGKDSQVHTLESEGISQSL
jgi:phosphoribosylformylglycinamidine synthase